MNLRDVGLCLVGGSILYVSMAACAGRPSGPVGSRGTSGGGGNAVLEGTGGGKGGGGTRATGGGMGGALGDPVPPAQAEPSAGSRLKPKYRLGDDGAKEYLAGLWFDSQRNEDCTFTLASDGKTRCMPPGTEFRYYTDAGCTTPMVLLQNACAAPRYGIANADAACGVDPTSLHLFAIGAAVSPAMIYGKSGASCFAIGPTSPDYQYFAVGAEIPASSFVSASVAHD